MHMHCFVSYVGTFLCLHECCVCVYRNLFFHMQEDVCFVCRYMFAFCLHMFFFVFFCVFCASAGLFFVVFYLHVRFFIYLCCFLHAIFDCLSYVGTFFVSSACAFFFVCTIVFYMQYAFLFRIQVEVLFVCNDAFFVCILFVLFHMQVMCSSYVVAFFSYAGSFFFHLQEACFLSYAWTNCFCMQCRFFFRYARARVFS